jgi:ribonuclease HI
MISHVFRTFGRGRHPIAARLDFNCTNNIAEYEALLLGLRKFKAMGIRRTILKSDS